MVISLPGLSAPERLRMPPAPGAIITIHDVAEANILHHRVLGLFDLTKCTKQDVANTAVYRAKVVASFGGATPDWFVPALERTLGPIVERAVQSAIDRALQPAIDEALKPIKEDIQTLKDDNKAIKKDIQALKADSQIIKQDIRVMKEDVKSLKAHNQDIKDDIQILKDKSATIEGDIKLLNNVTGKTQRMAAILYNGKLGAGRLRDSRYEVVYFPDGSDPTRAPHNLPPLLSDQAISELSDKNLNEYVRNYCPNERIGRDRSERINMVAGAIGIGSAV